MRSSRKSSNFSRRRLDERERSTRPAEEPARSGSDNCRRRSGARSLRHCDQSPAETTWPSWLGDSFAKGSMDPGRATGSARAGGVRDRSLPRLLVAADGALSARDDRADTVDDLPGLSGPRRACRDHTRHLQRSPRPAFVFRRIRSTRLGHQACRTRESARRLPLSFTNARTDVRIAARARIAACVSPTSSARVDSAHSVKAAQDHRDPAPRRGPRTSSLTVSAPPLLRYRVLPALNTHARHGGQPIRLASDEWHSWNSIGLQCALTVRNGPQRYWYERSENRGWWEIWASTQRNLNRREYSQQRGCQRWDVIDDHPEPMLHLCSSKPRAFQPTPVDGDPTTVEIASHSARVGNEHNLLVTAPGHLVSVQIDPAAGGQYGSLQRDRDRSHRRSGDLDGSGRRNGRLRRPFSRARCRRRLPRGRHQPRRFVESGHAGRARPARAGDRRLHLARRVVRGRRHRG